MKKIGVLLILVAMVVAGSSCIWPAPLLTADAIADNYAEFFSVQHDREDIKEGTFKLSPWSGDTFEIDAKAMLVVHQEDTTRKKRSGRDLNVETKTQYWLEEIQLSPVMSRGFGVKRWDEIKVEPVKIQIIAARQSIDKDSAEALRRISADGKRHRFRVQVDRIRNLDGSSLEIFYATDLLRAKTDIFQGQETVREDVGSLSALPYLGGGRVEKIRFVLPVEIVGVDGVAVRSVDPF